MWRSDKNVSCEEPDADIRRPTRFFITKTKPRTIVDGGGCENALFPGVALFESPSQGLAAFLPPVFF
jgi:hypothetical protein